MKLKIQPCLCLKSGILIPIPPVFKAMINPESYKRDFGINYNRDKSQGKLSPELKFNSYDEEKISFDFILDGTGVVNGETDVPGRLKKLKNIVYKYVGYFHEPNVVRVAWGDLAFYGRLTSMGVNYTLFKPDGIPLRAKVSLAFSKYVNAKEESKKAERSSPDLTHTRLVKDGDTLPLLCHEIYEDPSLYLYVARHNKLTDFRHLLPGSRLYFPPIDALNIPEVP